jgi:hypothetical protein
VPYYVVIGPDGAVLYAGTKSSIDNIIADEMINHPPQLVDQNTEDRALQSLAAAEQALAAGDPHRALKIFGQIDGPVRKDARISGRYAAVSRKLSEAAEQLLGEVDGLIKEKHYVEAATQLKELAKVLVSTPKLAAVQKRQGQLAADPEAQRALEQAEKQAAADTALAAARELHDEGHDEDAYGKLKLIVAGYANSSTAKSALELIAELEKNPDLMARIQQRDTEGKAKAALSLAAGLRQNGKLELARAKYEQIAREFPNTSFAEEAKKALATLKNPQ